MIKKHKRSLKINHLFNEQAGLCVYCDCCMTLELGYDNTATVDHVVPKALGGQKTKQNEVAACHACNNIKGSIDISTWLKILQEKRHERGARQKDIDSTAHISKAGYRLAGYREGARPN